MGFLSRICWINSINNKLPWCEKHDWYNPEHHLAKAHLDDFATATAPNCQIYNLILIVKLKYFKSRKFTLNKKNHKFQATLLPQERIAQSKHAVEVLHFSIFKTIEHMVSEFFKENKQRMSNWKCQTNQGMGTCKLRIINLIFSDKHPAKQIADARWLH